MSNGYELYENQFGVHTLELNLKLSGFDEYLPWTSLDFTETSNALQRAFYTRNGNLRVRIQKRTEV